MSKDEYSKLDVSNNEYIVVTSLIYLCGNNFKDDEKQ